MVDLDGRDLESFIAKVIEKTNLSTTYNKRKLTRSERHLTVTKGEIWP